MAKAEYSILVKDLHKSFGKVKVLEGINLQARPGTVLALLGPNGAGKTTTIRILSTLLQPGSGTAQIAGYDVIRQPSGVRASIGLTGQFAAVDEYLTGEENLLMIGRLYRLSVEDTKRRAAELLKLVDLTEASTRTVKTYSGGMKRKIDLAMSLISAPPVIFLDEPTTGLDPRSRLAMWDVIKQLTKSGTTILLTTQYMDEADHLADNIVVIDGGKVIAEGTADTLKAKVGSDRLEITIGKKSSLDKAVELIDGKGHQIDRDRRVVSITSKGGVSDLKAILQHLESGHIVVDSISLHRPTLDDVFMSLTGHVATEESDTEVVKSKVKK